MRTFISLSVLSIVVGCGSTSTPTDATDVEVAEVSEDTTPADVAEATPDVEDTTEVAEEDTAPPADVSEDTPPEATGDVAVGDGEEAADAPTDGTE